MEIIVAAGLVALGLVIAGWMVGDGIATAAYTVGQIMIESKPPSLQRPSKTCGP